MPARHRLVVWTEQARDALDEAVTYVAVDSRPAAERLLQEVLDKAASLASLARRGRIVPELGQPEVREIFIQKYRLLYEVAMTRVTVLAFLHSARDFAAWQRDG